MTPRSVGKAEPPDQTVLETWLQDCEDVSIRASDEARALMAKARSVVPEHPARRLVAIRAFLDRAEEIRFSVGASLMHARDAANRQSQQAEWALAGQAQTTQAALVGRGMSADERRWRYQLAQKPEVTFAQAMQGAVTMMANAEHLIRECVQALDRHRMEALTMSKAGTSVSAQEYALFADDPSEDGTVPTGATENGGDAGS